MRGVASSPVRRQLPCIRARKGNRRGNTMVLVLLLLPALIAVSAMAINIAYMELARTEAQISVDAATRAAGLEFSRTRSHSMALNAARDMASRNPVGGKAMPINASDLVLGGAYRPTATARYQFDASSLNPNAVWIRSSGLANQAGGAIKPLFPVATPYNFRPLRQAITVRNELDIALVIDRSGSMAFAADEISNGKSKPKWAWLLWDFGQPVPMMARWLDLVAGVQAFTDVLTISPVTERVSLTTYYHWTTAELPLTTDYAAINGRLSAYSSAFPGGATNIGDGITVGLNSLFDPLTSRSHASKVIVVMTDGIHNSGKDPLLASVAAKNSNVIIYSVTFSQEANKSRMDAVANPTGGRNIHATNRAELVAAFEDIARALPSLVIQ